MSMIFTERQAIKGRLEEISQNRMREADERQMLMQRLRELDNQEKQAIDCESVLGSLMETVNTLARLIPSIPLNVVLEDIKRDFDRSGIIEHKKEEIKPLDNNIIDHDSVLRQKANDSTITHKVTLPTRDGIVYRRGKGNQYDIKQTCSLLVTIFKEKGIPMKSIEIERTFKDKYNMNWNNFTNAMIQMMKHDKKIQRVPQSFGFYQYVTTIN